MCVGEGKETWRNHQHMITEQKKQKKKHCAAIAGTISVFWQWKHSVIVDVVPIRDGRAASFLIRPSSSSGGGGGGVHVTYIFSLLRNLPRYPRKKIANIKYQFVGVALCNCVHGKGQHQLSTGERPFKEVPFFRPHEKAWVATHHWLSCSQL